MLDKFYMTEALKQAKTAFEKDEVPVGAVIVHQNQIIAKAHNQIETLKDPTAHAEMIAITQAAAALKHKWLLDCSLYVTLEPCSMCAGALVLSRIPRIFYATEDPKTGACGSVLQIAQHSRLNHRIDISMGILREECSSLLQQFFELKRLKNP